MTAKSASRMPRARQIDNPRRFRQHPQSSGERGRHEEIAVALLIAATS